MAYSDTIRRYELRREAMRELHSQGWSMIRIAKRYRVTRQRVQQILGPLTGADKWRAAQARSNGR